MRPLPHRVTGGGTCFEHDRFEPALEQVCCGGQTDGAGADDCDGFNLRDAHLHAPSRNIEIRLKTFTPP
jgi:hypothetical protein